MHNLPRFLLQKAISGSADRAFAMRSRAEEVKEVIIADIRNNPDEPHMWSQITREVAFGGEVGWKIASIESYECINLTLLPLSPTGRH